jgi:eukaryotic-like serine/threonine-protein kinase
MPLNEIYKVGIAIAEALAAAHRQGIVHRDLKPGNIMLTQGGAKLMDFGLAKPLGVAAGTASAANAAPSFTAAPTLSGSIPLSPLTTAGAIVGTIQYMSPEQIEGKEADARSDIFAFGAVLYEMAAGKRPFEGKSQISVASSILEKDPDSIRTLNSLTPAAFEHVVATCLQKSPDDRYLAAHDIKLELQWIAAEKPASAEQPADAAVPPKHDRLGWAASLGAAVVLGLIVGYLVRHSAPQAPSTRAIINPPEKTTLDLTGDSAGPPVLSPDGTLIAFAASTEGKTSVWLRPVNSIDAHPLAGSENAIFPFWSPDSRSLGFFADGKLKTIEIETGSTQVVAEAPFGRGGAWSADGEILFSPNTQESLWRVNAGGGTPTRLTKLDPEHTSHRWPIFLPDGKHYMYLAIHHDPSKSANNVLYYASVDGSVNRPLLRAQSNAVYADGYLLFAQSDQLMAQPFDASSGKVKQGPQIIAKGIVNDAATWHMDASVSESGLLIFGNGGSGDWQLVWLDRSTKQITTVADKLPNLQTMQISPLGDRIALDIDTGTSDIWVLDIGRGVRTRLTFGPVQNTYPIWSPDGKWIAYVSDRNGHANLCRKLADGSGAEEMLRTDTMLMTPTDWSRDGKYIIFDRGAMGGQEVWALPLEGEHKAFMVVSHPNSGNGRGHLSPDGKWLAYMSDESGSMQAYVVGFGGSQGKWQVSVNSGGQPEWSKDGKELYYLDQTYNLYAVPVKEVAGALQFGTAETLVSNWSAPQVSYNVSPDGKKILLDRVAQQVNQSVTVMTNFTAGLKK